MTTTRRENEYKPYKELPPALLAQQGPALIALSLVDVAANPKYNDQDWPVRGKVVVAWKQLGMMLRWSQIKISCPMVPLNGQLILLLLSVSNDRGPKQGLRRSPIQQFCSARQRYTWRGSSSSASSLSPRASLGRSRSLTPSANWAGPTSASSPCSPPGIVHT